MTQESERDRPLQADLSDWASIANDLLAALPRLDAAAGKMHQEIAVWMEFVVNGPHATLALTHTIGQAANEMLDLLYECAHGRGRPALKSCRSLFDIWITIKDITGDPKAGRRYEDHRWVVFQQVAELENRRPIRRKGDSHRRHKALRRVAPEAARVLQQYGPRFQHSWRQDSLFDASARHGLVEDYQFFRLASAVMHGSSGGVLGQYVAESAHGSETRTYRVGGALSLCPDAFEHGLRYFQGIVQDVECILGVAETAEVLALCSELVATSPGYRDYIEDLDGRWWADVPGNHLVPVVSISSLGICRWYLYDPSRHAVREAEKPGAIPFPAADGSLQQIIRARKDGHVIPGVQTTDVLTVAMPGVRLRLKKRSSWRHAGELLQYSWQVKEGVERFKVIKRPSDWLSLGTE